MPQHKLFYDRRLPHIQPQEETFFITYRLADAIPMCKIKEFNEIVDQRKELARSKEEKYKQQKHYFRLVDGYLDKMANEPYWLKQPAIAEIVADSLHFCDGKFYKLWCYCVMPNHVHLVITTLKNAPPLYTILQKHKRHTAKECNKLLNRSGQFWTHESYDHVVRNNDEFNRIVFYTINNPVKAGFIKNWSEWKWAYIDTRLVFSLPNFISV
jgi:putative transposase